MSSLALLVLVALIGSIHCQFGRGNIPLECDGKVMDVFFLLDSSTSIYINDYREQHQFVRDVVNSLDISDRFTRVGALTYSDDFTRPVLRLTSSRSQSEVLRSITEANLPYRTGVTNTHTAIRYVRQLTDFRQGITKVMVVITDGGSRQQGSTAREAQLAREAGFYVFVVGVGQYRDEREWRNIASAPSERFIFNITEFRQLSNVATQLPGQICPLPPLRTYSCDVQQPADVIIAAGPTNNRFVLDVMQEFVASAREIPGRNLIYRPIVEACTASRNIIPTARANDLFNACDRSRRTSTEVENSTFQQLMDDVDGTIDQSSESRRKVVIFFMDSNLYNFARTGSNNFRLRSLAQQRGVEVVFAGVGVSSIGLQSIVEDVPRSVNFNLSDLDYQVNAMRSFVDFTCEAINTRGADIGSIQPN